MAQKPENPVEKCTSDSGEAFLSFSWKEIIKNTRKEGENKSRKEDIIRPWPNQKMNPQ